jgi:hypothetical protein
MTHDADPAATPDEPTTSAAPQRTLIESRKALAPAVLQMIGMAHRLLRVAHADLAPFELSNRAAVEALENYLLADRLARARLLVDDAGWLDRQAARLRLLQRRFPHALEMRVASTDDPVGEDALILADQQHVLSLGPGLVVRGDLWTGNEPRVQPLAAAFDRRWDAAAHNLPVAPLGL